MHLSLPIAFANAVNALLHVFSVASKSMERLLAGIVSLSKSVFDVFFVRHFHVSS